jgi:hypothetical protein
VAGLLPGLRRLSDVASDQNRIGMALVDHLYRPVQVVRGLGGAAIHDEYR